MAFIRFSDRIGSGHGSRFFGSDRIGHGSRIGSNWVMRLRKALQYTWEQKAHMAEREEGILQVQADWHTFRGCCKSSSRFFSAKKCVSFVIACFLVVDMRFLNTALRYLDGIGLFSLASTDFISKHVVHITSIFA